MGRKVIYTEKTREKVLSRLREGETLRSISRDAGMPSVPMVIAWTLEDREFAEQYAQARLIGYQGMADEIVDICENCPADRDAVAKARLQIDTRKWLLSKALPKMYGDKVQVEDVTERPAIIINEPIDITEWAKRYAPKTIEHEPKDE